MDQRERPGSDDAVELAMVRYQLAFEVYEGVADKNSWMRLNGDRPSEGARLEEERAFEELDCARHALFTAAEQAFPTIH